jgi:ketosteroid isomerase-like protein
MSEDNVEILRRGYECLRNTGELRWEDIDPDVEVHDPPLGPDSHVYHGHDGLRTAFRNVEESFDDVRFEVDEIHDAGDHVVVFVRMRGRGKGSEIEIEAPLAHLWTMRGGKGIRVRVLARQQALEAVGISKDDAH